MKNLLSCTCAPRCGGQKNLGCHSLGVLETGSLTGLDLTKWAKLAGQ